MIGKVVVLGGGPCGLALSYDLARAGVSVTLFEAEPALGGLAKSIRWGNSWCDLGPHKLFTLDESLFARVRALLPDDQWLAHPKISRIYLNGHSLHYPPTPGDLIRAFGYVGCVRCAMDLLSARTRGAWSRNGEPASFEEDARARVGASLYQLLFRPVARKIWGEPLDLDARLSKSRIQIPSLREAFRALAKRKEKSRWQADEYFYPKGGLNALWNAMSREITGQGGKILMGDPVSTLELDAQGGVAGVRTAGGRRQSLDASRDWVVSTLPLARLAAMMPSVPEEVRAAARRLRLNDLLLVFLKLTEDPLGENSWIFVPDATVVFHRMSGQRKFDPGMVEEGVHLVCCEVMSYPGRETKTMEDGQIVDRCIGDLVRMGRLSGPGAVLDRRLVRLPSTYPVLSRGYLETLQSVLKHFDGYRNLRTVGRQGAYNYIGMLDAIDTGFGLARWMVEGGAAREDWDSERRRTSFYPVLD